MGKKNIIVAGGGILHRKFNGEIQIALVKTSGKRAWCLPKGKQNRADESVLETAVREVQEETGCKVQPGEYAGDFSYSVGNATKLVMMWHMRLLKENYNKLYTDVIAVRWLSTFDAIALLDRKRERRFLSKLLQTNPINPEEIHRPDLHRPKSFETTVVSYTDLPDTVEFDILSGKK